jgi:hypothetical protein
MDGTKDEPPPPNNEYGTYFATWLTQIWMRDLVPDIPECKEKSVDPKDVERVVRPR